MMQLRNRRALYATICAGVGLLNLGSCVGHETAPTRASNQVTTVTQNRPDATREPSYPAFVPEISGYPELLSATAEPTRSPTPTSTGLPVPTARPTVMISYTLDSIDNWKIYVNEDYGIRLRYPPDSSVQTWNSDVGRLAGREITFVIGVSEDGSGVIDRNFWVYVNAYQLPAGQSLEEFQQELSAGFGHFDDGPPRGGYPTYTPILEDIQGRLAQYADGGARLQYDKAVDRAGFFLKHGDIGYLVTFGVDMMTNPSDLDVEILQVIMGTLEFLRH